MPVDIKIVSEFALRELDVDGIMVVTIEHEPGVLCVGGYDTGLDLQTKIRAVNKLMLDVNEECRQNGLPEPFPDARPIVYRVDENPQTPQTNG